jgi:hypothetical protein
LGVASWAKVARLAVATMSTDLLRLSASLALLLLAGACRRSPPEPAAATDASAPAPAPQGPTTHVVALADHLHLVDLAIGDLLEAPHEDAFVWTLRSKEPALSAAPPLEGGRERLRAAQAGGAQAIATGEPKCWREDASCGTSKREWTVFVRVH